MRTTILNSSLGYPRIGENREWKKQLEAYWSHHLTEEQTAYLEAKQELGIDGKPVMLGPYSFVRLAKGYAKADVAAVLRQLLPLYRQILCELEQAGVKWLQVDEPFLVTSVPEEDLPLLQEAYQCLQQAAPHIQIMLQTYFAAVEHYAQIVQLPVQGIGLDFIHGQAENLQNLQRFGFPEDKILGVGLVDGRNIWRTDLSRPLELLAAIEKTVPINRMILQPSCSLLHVPVSLSQERQMDPQLQQALAFADEKLDEIVVLTKALRSGVDSVKPEIQRSLQAVQQLALSPARADRPVAGQLSAVSTKRRLPFVERQVLQQQKFRLPALPTTTIGSFPQTPEIRRARQLWRKGDWTKEQYDSFIRSQIKTWLDIQEGIGLDVLVHGEFERTDMVEFFGEKLQGFAFTQNGWVQSYGSRCVKPPIIYGTVNFIKPMTVEETMFAQSQTRKPVKGMLTGPVTILNWSFVRDDIPRQEVVYQIALALRKEIEALETAGIRMIQVDEPALREGLPLREQDRCSYLSWAAESFRLATSGVQDTTQIHTHMCYCEFHDMIDAMDDLDADVISIETSRSHGELISSFETETYDKGIGLGVYDIHSPRVPAKAEIVDMIERALRVLPHHLFWINPDCGLKTRGIAETAASLKVMVEAAHEVRFRLGLPDDSLSC